jgi:hypothetical protein
MVTPPYRNHPLVSRALQLARMWATGHQIDGAPALGHAVRVANQVTTHQPKASPELVAAVLLHDAPEYAAAAGVQDLDEFLTAELSPEVPRIIRGIEHEHQTLDSRGQAHPPIGDPPVLLASAADKTISMRSILDRAETAEDAAAY